MTVPGWSTVTALEIASCELLRPVRKMYLFHLSPVIESATAGSTSSTFLYSSATGSMAGAAIDVGDLDVLGLRPGQGGGECGGCDRGGRDPESSLHPMSPDL